MCNQIQLNAKQGNLLVMGLKDKAKELIDKAEERSEKNEARANEIAGKISGDPQRQAEGKAKKAEAEARHDAKKMSD
jgi:uncharacterized protein YjbJ (UPF0337 family)